MSYLANLSIFCDCSNTSQTQATCSCVNPKEDIPPGEAERPEAELVEDTGVTGLAAEAPKSRPGLDTGVDPVPYKLV